MAKKRSVYAKPRAQAPDPRFEPLAEAETDTSVELAGVVPTSSATGLRAQPQAEAVQSLEAKAFRRTLARLERLKAQLGEMNRDCLAHQAASARLLQPLIDQQRAGMREMVLTLDPWLDVETKGLTKLQKETARQIICHLTQVLAELGQTDMAELHDRRSPRTVADKRALQADQMRDMVADMFEELFGAEPPSDLDGSDPEAVMRAAVEKMQALAAEEDLRRQAKAQARQAKRKPSAAQQQAAQARQDADALLRGVYRQLASALHPDRAPDEAERARMNALMSEANAAYGRKDLVTLLNLQLRAELVDPDHLDRLSDERLKSLTLLLKQQVAELERERQIEQGRWQHTLNLPPSLTLKAKPLQLWLLDLQNELTCELATMRADIEAAGTLATLKPWLNGQRRRVPQPLAPDTLS